GPAARRLRCACAPPQPRDTWSAPALRRRVARFLRLLCLALPVAADALQVWISCPLALHLREVAVAHQPGEALPQLECLRVLLHVDDHRTEHRRPVAAVEHDG